MSRIRKDFRINEEVVTVADMVANETHTTLTRVIESALVAYAAQVLGEHPAVVQARYILTREVNKRRT